jgi:hypothetical protein
LKSILKLIFNLFYQIIINKLVTFICGNVPSQANMNEIHELFLQCGKLKSFNIQNGSGYIVSHYIYIIMYIGI